MKHTIIEIIKAGVLGAVFGTLLAMVVLFIRAISNI